jgi:hypothetical protein
MGFGCFHMVFICCPLNLYNEYVICNCCTCGCAPYIIKRELTQRNYPLIDGYFMAVTDPAKCKACGKCMECARSPPGGSSTASRRRRGTASAADCAHMGVQKGPSP